MALSTYLLHHVLCLVLLLALLTSTPATNAMPIDDNVLRYFDVVVSLHFHNDSLLVFVDQLAATLIAPVTAFFVIESWSATVAELSQLGVSSNDAPNVRHLNLTCVGSLDQAIESSGKLMNLPLTAQSQLGILALRMSRGSSLMTQNESFGLTVLLLPNVTVGVFIARLSSYVNVAAGSFEVDSCTALTPAACNVTLLGVNAKLVGNRVTSLGSLELSHVGATLLSARAVAVAASSSCSSCSDVVGSTGNSTVGGFIILGGLFAAALLMMVVHARRGGFAQRRSAYAGNYFFRRRQLQYMSECEVVVGVIIAEPLPSQVGHNTVEVEQQPVQGVVEGSDSQNF